MKITETVNSQRRNFLLSSSILLLGTSCLKSSLLHAQTASADSPSGPDLSETLSPEETELVKQSVMSEDMQNFWHKGYSCAETGLMVALRFLKKPEDLVWVAAGFGGGLGHQDLCGFLTSGVMAAGLRAGDLNIDKDAAKMHCGRTVREYWSWWTQNAPLHCTEIRQGRQDFNVCHRLGRLAAAKLEDLLVQEPQAAPTQAELRSQVRFSHRVL